MPKKLIKFMILQKNIISYKKLLIYAFFIVLHVSLFNINAVEWGDTYRILRASEFIRQGSYPEDEKRPPLFSAVLALRPQNVEQVFWGKITLFAFSLGVFVLFDKFLQKFIKNEKIQNLCLLLFSFNPVFLYWSLRVYADVPFTFFVLLGLYLLTIWKDSLNAPNTSAKTFLMPKNSFAKILLLGLITSLSILTRFEGYLLFAAICAGLFFSDTLFDFKVFLPKNFFPLLKENFKKVLCFIFSTLLFLVPYWFYRNPLTSSYLEEPERRVYDLKMVWIYLASLFVVTGIIPFFFLLFKKRNILWDFIRSNVGILVFLILDVVLILLWPAAIPRLFIPLIPFLLLILGFLLSDYISRGEKLSKADVAAVLLCFVFYLVSQYFLKLQFLIMGKFLILSVVVLQISGLFFLYVKKYRIGTFLTLLSVFAWSLINIWVHKDMLISIKSAAEYASKNLSGNVAYNDMSSVSDWYLNYSQKDKKTKGFFVDTDAKKNLTFEGLKKKNVDYFIITNEHNTDLEIDVKKRPYLEEIKEFRYNVNGGEFFAKIVRFNKEYKE